MRDALAALPEGNASSLHAEGRLARDALDRARDTAAGALGCDRAEIVFTSSGTEAINLALLGAGRRLPAGRLCVSWQAEHQAVLAALRRLTLEHLELTLLPNSSEAVNLGPIPEAAALVSISVANNEIGTLQPRPEVPPGALLHLDACQGPRWLEVALAGVDLASFSGHKLGAGRGGLLFVRQGVRLEPLLYGGPQERGRRAGWEDVQSATAMAVALQTAVRRRTAAAERARPLAARLQAALISLGGMATGAGRRLPNLASAVFAGLRGEDLLLALDLGGVAASSGSACASGSLDPSHVLMAAGFSPEDAASGLRLSVGWDTTTAEVEVAINRLEAVVKRFTKVAAS